MGRGVKIPWIGGSIYHWEGGQNTMDRGVNIPWIRGVDIPWVGHQNTIGRGSIYHGYIFFCVSVVNISFLGKQINIT